MSNPKVLIITYYWPPSGGVGVQRWMNYAIELKKQGWEPIIYTPQNPQFELRDRSLMQKTCDIRVIKTKIWEPFRIFHLLSGGKNKGQIKQGLVLEKEHVSLLDKFFIWIRGNLFVPDPRKFWVESSVRFLETFIQKEGIKTIITTGPPHSMHLIGLGLKKKINIHWLADFRDPWSKWDVLDKLKTGSAARSKHKKLEKEVLESADRVVTVTPQLVEDFNLLSGKKDAFLLYNGVSLPLAKPTESMLGLTLGHFGMLNELRNAPALWKALDRLSQTQDLKLRLGGIVSDQVRNQILSFPLLKDRTEFLGYLDHQEVMSQYKECNVLLLLQNNSHNSASLLPLKFFEYLAASSYVLILGPRDNELARLVQDAPTCRLIDPKDADGIIEALTYFQEVKPDFSKSRELYHRFTHAHQTTQLIKLLAND